MTHNTTLEQERSDVLQALYEYSTGDSRVLIHGSIAHAALREIQIPSVRKVNGDVRDIDVYFNFDGELAADADIVDEFTGNIPLDYGIADVLRQRNGLFVASKNDVQVELEDADLFSEEQDYELHGTNGLMIRSFSPLGMYAIHHLIPGYNIRPQHPVQDAKFLKYCEDMGLRLPTNLAESIRVFHEEYNNRYPNGQLLTAASQLYIATLPESVRKHPRRITHTFMKRHAGRETPYAD